MLPSEQYDLGLTDRRSYELRAERISEVSLPYLFRSEGSNDSTNYEHTQSQSYVGRLINVLTSKIGMAVLPPNVSSFKFSPDKEGLAELTQGNKQANSIINQTLSRMQVSINNAIENQQIRTTLFDAIKQWIAVGPTILEKVKGKGIRIHGLRNITYELDGNDEPLWFVFHETITHPPDGYEPKQEQDEYKLFTMLRKDDNSKWELTQEIDGELIGKPISYTDDSLPYVIVGWTKLPNDKYHRPYAEDYLSDMIQLEKLAKLLTDGAMIAAKSLLFVNQRGKRTRKDDVANADNGSVMDGSAEDVTAFQLGKNFDFQMPQQREAEIKRDLASAFLLNESATRDAERVTATEVQFMARELELSSLSGFYSRISDNVSKWLIRMMMEELNIKFKAVEVDIITGLDALGRSDDARRLDGYVQRMMQLDMKHWLEEEELASRYAQIDNIDMIGLVKDSDTVAKERKQAQQQMQQQQEQEAGTQAAANVAEEAGKQQVQQSQAGGQ